MQLVACPANDSGKTPCARLLEIMHEVQSVDLVRLEESPESQSVQAASRFLVLAEDATRSLSELLDHLDRAGEEGPIAGLAFVARMAMGQKRAALEAATRGGERWSTLGALGSTKRELMRSVDRLLAELAIEQGVDYARTGFMDELEVALATRYAYHRFAQTLTAEPTEDASQLAARLRTVANAIARLTGREVYPHARIDDRAALRSIQARVRAALGAMNESAAWVADAGRLLQDAFNLGQFFLEVNRRAELVEHDNAVVEELLAAIGKGDAGHAELQRRARPLLGRDGALDALIGATTAPVEAWSRTLQMLRITLGGGFGDPFGAAA